MPPSSLSDTHKHAHVYKPCHLLRSRTHTNTHMYISHATFFSLVPKSWCKHLYQQYMASVFIRIQTESKYYTLLTAVVHVLKGTPNTVSMFICIHREHILYIQTAVVHVLKRTPNTAAMFIAYIGEHTHLRICTHLHRLRAVVCMHFRGY